MSNHLKKTSLPYRKRDVLLVFHKLWIKQFRNLNETVLSFQVGKNVVITGDNNNGKTSFLEAIYYLSHLSSCFNSVPKQMIQWGQQELFLGIAFENGNGCHQSYVKLTSEKKMVFQNQTKLRSYADYCHQFLITYVSADSVRFFQESPSFRRQQLDRLIQKLWPATRRLYQKYERVLKQKNRAVMMGKAGDSTVFDAQWKVLSYDIVQNRYKVTQQLEHLIQTVKDTFSCLKDKTISLHYCLAGMPFDCIECADRYDAVLTESLKKNIDSGYVIGAHRDDIMITIDGKRINHYYSRGINRFVVLVLEWCKQSLLQKKFQMKPVMLLDDTFVELDHSNKRDIMTFLWHEWTCFYATVTASDKAELMGTDPGIFLKKGHVAWQ